MSSLDKNKSERVRAAAALAPSEPLARFVHRCFDPVAPEVVLERDPAALFDLARSLWSAGAGRLPGASVVRVTTEASTVVEIVNGDMPFLVDSVQALFAERELGLRSLLHPVVPAEEAQSGERESFIRVEAEALPADRAEELRQELVEVFADVRAAVLDFAAMKEQVLEVIREARRGVLPINPTDLAEETRFLEWLIEEGFTFLGYRELALIRKADGEYLEPVAGTALGVLRTREEGRSFHQHRLSEKMREFAQRSQLLFVTKSNSRSRVHRRDPFDYVGIRRFDDAGRVVGERRLVGLFTSAAKSRPVRDTPLLSQKVWETVTTSGFTRGGHDYKALLDILEGFPREELYQISRQRLKDWSLEMLQVLEHPRVALFVRMDPFGRFASCHLLLPREKHSAELTDRVTEILEEAFGSPARLVHDESRRGSALARLQFLVSDVPASRVEGLDLTDLERRISEAARRWEDRLAELLGDAAARERYSTAFPAAYRERFAVSEALADAAAIEAARAENGLRMRLYRLESDPPEQVHFKLFQAGRMVELGDTLPILTNLALWVTTEVPYELQLGDGSRVFVHDYTLVRRSGQPFDLERLQETFPEAFLRVLAGEAENDGFNKLVTRAALAWHEVLILRAYARYLRQLPDQGGQGLMETSLASHPEVAQLLVERFRVRFDPTAQEGVEARLAAVDERLETALRAVDNPAEYRVLRAFQTLLQHTLRTNHFQRAADGSRKPYLSFKFRAENLELLPKPRPLFETWVYSPRMEGVHLRGGKVARGGIRWSDRRDDFRTEILGLVKTQKVKNTVIVPVGAKGGFILKQAPPANQREAFQAEGVACYQTLVRGLLDLVDNLDDGRLVFPPSVVRVDNEPDPYLVVAADKGTATFSNIANALSAEYNFWLDDAFASGGSQGYDHKGMGITAKGAWEAVKRHFRELGTNIQTTDFTVTGVGDMSGDVFGNGMLLSEHIRLIGAFDHRHIFVDPDPDAATSFAERQRLFDLPRSSWMDYDRTKLSPGGGVFDRAARTIDLPPEAAKRFGFKSPSVTPTELMRAILLADVDLLWLGGIGTYVKSSDETHAEVRDHGNDLIRVDATELRCKVVGEGANLGFTQAGRVEFATEGGRLNTDAIDNSAGVDTSDHEVNIKILLAQPVARGELSRADRNELIAAMTDEVGALVLRDNYLQSQAISVAEAAGLDELEAQQRLIRTLERQGRLDRVIEGLPDDETLAERAAAGRGLTRPELAVVLAYAKIGLNDDLLTSDVLDEPLLARDLAAYFPPALQERFPADIASHRLRREIIATAVTNGLINRVGPTFVAEMVEQSGADPAEVVRAFTVVRQAFGLERLWAEIEGLDDALVAEAQLDMLATIGTLVERVTLWLLRSVAAPLDVGALAAALGTVVAELAGGLDGLLPSGDREELHRRARALNKRGVPAPLALDIAQLEDLAAAYDLWRIAQAGFAVADVARVYYLVGDRLHCERLREQAAELASPGGRWQSTAVALLTDALYQHQAAATRGILEGAQDPANARQAIDHWTTRRTAAAQRYKELAAEIKASKSPELAMITVAEDQLRKLVAG